MTSSDNFQIFNFPNITSVDELTSKILHETNVMDVICDFGTGNDYIVGSIPYLDSIYYGIGCSVGLKGPKNYYESLLIYIAPEYRGKGLGKLLKQEQIRFAQENNYTGLLTYVSSKNEASIRLQEKLGFSFEEIDSDEYLVSKEF